MLKGESGMKMRLNFAHGSTLTDIIAGMTYDQREKTHFASTLFFELWHDDNR